LSLLEKTLTEENTMISKIIATHWHLDHVGSISDLLKKNNLVTDDCEVWKFPRNQEKEDMGFHELKNMQEIEIDGIKLKIFHTPGHTTDHIILYDEASQSVFSGDTILGEGTAVFEDLFDYMKSLDLILKLKPKTIYPAHGDVIDDNAVRRIELYIKHRNEREKQILAAIEGSKTALSVLQIVRSCYTTTPIHLWIAAAKVVNQHLAKLKKEAKVEEVIGYTGTYYQATSRNKL
jgi:endoribonuclease LACTB2